MIKRKKCNILAALLICATALSGFSTLAKIDRKTYLPLPVSAAVSSADSKHFIEEAVLKLVEEGKLSKDKAEKILEYKKNRLNELSKQDKLSKEQLKQQRKKGSLLRDMIHDGIITEAEGEAIKAKLNEMKETRLNGGLQQLVDSGVLSGQDIDNIRTYMLKQRDERKEQLEQLNAMTPEERDEYFKRVKKDRKDIITRMVEDEVITEKQAEEIRKAVPELDMHQNRKAR